MTARQASTGKHLAHFAHASRKDLRDAVVAARSAFSGWSSYSASLRGQILYRAAEVIEGRSDSFAREISDLTGDSLKQSKSEVEAAVDALVYFAGWTDKYSQVFSSVNPVASAHFNFSFPEPTGVVGIVSPNEPPFLALVSLIAQVILTGNSVVVLASETAPLSAISLSEALATSDIPGGVVNVLTGLKTELAPWISGHMDVNAIIDASGDPDILAALQSGTGANLKRVYDHSLPSSMDWFGESARDPYRIIDTVEFKTAWHPMGV